MPNHITSELIFRGIRPTEQNELLKLLCSADSKVDLGILVPRPLNLWEGNESINYEKAFGKRLGMSWSRDNWGTKWNAYSTRAVVWADDVLTLVFDTAWAPPFPWLAAVFNRTKRDFEHNWLNEGAEWTVSGNWSQGKPDDVMGPQWREDRASREVHERLHTLKWGVPSWPEEEEA